MDQLKTIWFYRWDSICQGNDLGEDKNNPGIHHVQLTHIAGQRSGGTTCCRESEIYFSESDCLKAVQAEEYQRKLSYIQSIKTVEDLVDFLLQHTVFGEDYDVQAREAAIQAARNLGLFIHTDR